MEAELLRGELQVVCNKPLGGQRAYYLVTPEAAPDTPALAQFRRWLLRQADGALVAAD